MAKRTFKTNIFGGRNREIIQLTSIGVMVGMLTGFLSIAFNLFITRASEYLAVVGTWNLKPRFIVLPLLAGAIVSIMRDLILQKDRSGFGVVPVMQELFHIQTFLMKPKDVIIKFLGTLVSVIGGLSVGRFGPVVHLGGAIGSNIGYLFKFKKNHIRLLIGCGVAGSIAGVFNAPLFATLFVLEILFNKKFLEYFTPIVLSSVTSIIVSRYFLGDYTIVSVSGHYGLLGYGELINYAFLGLVFGGLGILYIKTIVKSKAFFANAPWHPAVSPLIGGACIAFIGFFVPEIFEVYNYTIHKIAAGDFTLGFLLLLFVAKLLATGISLGSGALGGSFTPGLFIGAAAGSFLGRVLELGFNIPVFSYGTYAVVGMAAMFSGFANAPLTATVMILEITDNYELILPILLATTVSSITAELFYKETIYSVALNQLEESEE